MKRGSQYLLRDVLGIQPGEGTLVALMFLLSFFIGIAKVVLQTTGGALFLTQYSKEFIPFLYVISALIVSSIGFAYTKLAQGYRLRSLLMLNLAFMLGSVLFYRVLLWGVPAAWPSLLVAVWYDVIKLLTSLAFWGLAERLFDIRQAKRLYGLIGSGEIFAAIWVGLSVPAIVTWIGTANLLWIVTIALVLCLALSILILRGHRSNEKQNLSDTHSSSAKQEKSSGQGMRALFNNRYVLLIFAMIALSYAGYYLVVNMFYVQSAERFPDADKLAVFLSKFWALTGVITFFSRTLLTGPVLRRGGLTLGLLILPISVCAGTILVLTIQWSMSSVALVFWMVAMTRMLEKVFRDSIDKSAGLILYKPLSPKLRIQAQSTVEGIIGPFAGGIIGLGLLFLSQFAFFDLSSMAIMTFINAVLWIAIGLMIPKRYISMLTQALAKRRLDILVDFSIQEKSVINVIRRGLYSPRGEEVIYCLGLYENIDRSVLKNALQVLLDHPSIEVRLESLRLIEKYKAKLALPQVRKCGQDDPEPKVRGRAFRTLYALGGDKVFDEVLPYLEDECFEIKMGIMEGMIRHGGKKSRIWIDVFLQKLERSREDRDRLFLASIIGIPGMESEAARLNILLEDESLEVRKAALHSAKQLKDPRLFSVLFHNLFIPRYRQMAIAALAACGDSIVERLHKTFESATLTRRMRIRMIGIAGRIGTPKAMKWLNTIMHYPDEEIRHTVLEVLFQLEYQPVSAEIARIQTLLDKEIRNHIWNLSALADLDSTYDSSTLHRALQRQLQRGKHRILFLLSFLYDPNAFQDILENLSSPSAEKRAFALELLEQLLDTEQRKTILPLMEEQPLPDMLKKLSSSYPWTRMDPLPRLRSIVEQLNDSISLWSRCCALHEMGLAQDSQFDKILVQSLDSEEFLIRESATWAIGQRKPRGWKVYLKRMANDEIPHVSRLANSILAREE